MSLQPSHTIVAINFWPEPTGNAPYTSDLAEEIAKSSRVSVLTGIPHYPWWKKQQGHSDFEYESEHSGLTVSRCNHMVPNSQSNALRALMEISFGMSAIMSGKVQGSKIILVSPAMLSSALVMAWIRLSKPKTKVLVWVQDLYEQGLKETSQGAGLLGRVIARTENWLLGKADRVVFAHPVFMDAKKINPSVNQKFFAIPNWSQFTFKPNKTIEETKSLHGFDGGMLVLHIGNMGVKQGLENVVEAARLAENSNRQVSFVLVGGGNQLEKLKESAAGLKNLFFIPPVSEPELANLMQAADVLLVNERPGVKEMSIPSKLTTYFLAGKPVLVCSEPDSLAGRSVLENRTGFWVQSGNPNQLLTKIFALDSSESEKIVKAASKFAEENLSKQAAMKQFKEVLEQL